MQIATANQLPALLPALGFPPEAAAVELDQHGCSVPGCLRRPRLRIGSRGACGRGHLEFILRDSLAAEYARAARTRLRLNPVFPVGQILLRVGAVTEAALADALRAQERAGAGRVGAWLRQQAGLGEHALAAALAAQQSCPVLSLDEWRPDASLAPQFILEQCGGIPLRHSGNPGLIAVAFEDAGCPELLRALERVHACRVTQGVLPATLFWEAARSWLALRQPPAKSLGALALDACPEILSSFLMDADARAASLAVLGDQLWLRYAPGDEGRERSLVCTLVEGAGLGAGLGANLEANLGAVAVEDAAAALGQTA